MYYIINFKSEISSWPSQNICRDVTVGTFLVQPLRCWAESAPPGRNRVKVFENLGATAVTPVAPVVKSLNMNLMKINVVKTQVYENQNPHSVIISPNCALVNSSERERLKREQALLLLVKVNRVRRPETLHLYFHNHNV